MHEEAQRLGFTVRSFAGWNLAYSTHDDAWILWVGVIHADVSQHWPRLRDQAPIERIVFGAGAEVGDTRGTMQSRSVPGLKVA